VIVGDLSLTLDQRERLADFAEAADLARLAMRNSKGDILDPIAVRRPPAIRIGDISIALPPAAFLQASPAAEAVLVGELTAALRGARRVADLYAGLGAFAAPLSTHAVVHAVEGDAAAAGALRLAAARAGRRISVEVRDLARRPLGAAELDGFDAVVFDPPRIGAKEQAGEIARSNAPLVAAVSCAPSSFARDARLLVAGGYRLERVLPVDQFVWSSEVEIFAVFRRPG
jgi:23S rRNA (uracil1939-C5)-methyltransferase